MEIHSEPKVEMEMRQGSTTNRSHGIFERLQMVTQWQLVRKNPSSARKPVHTAVAGAHGMLCFSVRYTACVSKGARVQLAASIPLPSYHCMSCFDIQGCVVSAVQHPSDPLRLIMCETPGKWDTMFTFQYLYIQLYR